MKSFVALFAFVAVASCIPQYRPQPSVRVSDSKNAETLRYDFDNIGVDGYSYGVQTSDGQSKEEQGQLINPESIAARGQFSYVGDDGVTYTVTYTADENGFHPEGAHLPRAS